MTPSKKIRKLYAEGYQLTPGAYNYLSNLQEVDEVIDRILNSTVNKAILSIEDIDEFTTTSSVETSEIIEESSIEETAKVEEKIPEIQKKEEKIVTEKKEIQSEPKKVTRSRAEKVSSDLEIVFSPETQQSATSSESFRNYFKSRYNSIYSIFSKRRDITNRITTKDLIPNRNRDKVSLIAMVTKAQKTRKGTVILELEDLNGSITGIVHSSKQDLITKSEFILEDSVLCFTGNWWKDILSVDNVLWPDIPYHKSNFAYDDVYALFISDIHIGSKNFAENLLLRAIKFVNGKLESDKHNEIGKKIKYLLVGGDVVDGVGVYPGQIDDLEQKDLRLQYQSATHYFEQIREDVDIIIIPGNHDGARSAEPQTPIQREFAPDLYGIDNIHLLGSPCYLKAHNVEIMMHHGNSILDINAAIPAISHETSIPAMVRMLENRHIVPLYGRRTPIAPESEDRLVISRIPDIFQTGHTHIAGDETYKGVTLINSGTFQHQTSYQKSMNINPTTGMTYVINLKLLQRSPINFQEIK